MEREEKKRREGEREGGRERKGMTLVRLCVRVWNTLLKVYWALGTDGIVFLFSGKMGRA